MCCSSGSGAHLPRWHRACRGVTPAARPRCQLRERRGEQPAQRGQPTDPPVCKQCQLWAARLAAERASGAAGGRCVPGDAALPPARLRACISAHGQQAGKGKICCWLFRPRANDNSSEQSFSGRFCQELVRQMLLVLLLPCFQLLSCPFLVFAFIMGFSCLGKGEDSPRSCGT